MNYWNLYSVLLLRQQKESQATKIKSPKLSKKINGRLDNITQFFYHNFMDKNEDDKLSLTADERYWLERKSRRTRWDEWGSPIGLSLSSAIFILSIGGFLYLLRLAGLLS